MTDPITRADYIDSDGWAQRVEDARVADITGDFRYALRDNDGDIVGFEPIPMAELTIPKIHELLKAGQLAAFFHPMEAERG